MKSTENKDYLNEQRSKLSALMKAPSSVPIQEIRPVQATPAVLTKLEQPGLTSNEKSTKEVHVNFKVDEKLMERVWIYAAQNRKTLKQIAILALTEYLDRNQTSTLSEKTATHIGQ